MQLITLFTFPPYIPAHRKSFSKPQKQFYSRKSILVLQMLSLRQSGTTGPETVVHHKNPQIGRLPIMKGIPNSFK